MRPVLVAFSAVCAVLTGYGNGQEAATSQANNLREPKLLQANTYESLASLSNAQEFAKLLSPIMVRRIPGTQPHEKVRKHIVDTLEGQGFTVWTQDFLARVPSVDQFISGQELPFSNVIATFHPSAPRRLVYACHYDSKYNNARSGFVGAIDSAVPCAMLLDMARTLSGPLAAIQNPDVTLQLIFFDGEEAFLDWSATDSLYGSRALANLWAQTGELQKIDMMVLLDLLGTEIGSCSPSFFRQCPEIASYMRPTQGMFNRLVDIEDFLSRRKLLTNHQGLKRYFQKDPKYHYQVEDDHVPFMKRGVPILHAITVPFPSTWHTEDDNAASLHWPTIQNLNTIFRLHAAEYLGLDSI